MKKRAISLFAAFSMVASVAVGMVQSVYADEALTIAYDADNSSETTKIVNLYYGESVDGLQALGGTFVFSVDGLTSTFEVPWTTADGATLNYVNNKVTLDVSADESLKTANRLAGTLTITVPDGVDSFTVQFTDASYMDDSWESVEGLNSNILEISNPSTPDPEPVVSAVETTLVQAAYQGEANDGSVADIYKATITANDFAVTGASVTVNGETKEIEVPVIASGTADFAIVIGYAGGASLGYEPEVTLN